MYLLQQGAKSRAGTRLHGWGQEIRSSPTQPRSPLATRPLVEHFLVRWLAAVLNGLRVIGRSRYAVCGLRSWWFRWFLATSREIEGAGPTAEKWRVWSPRTGAEWKHGPRSSRDRAGARSDGAHNTPVPENLLICTRQVSGFSQQLRFITPPPASRIHKWRDITTVVM